VGPTGDLDVFEDEKNLLLLCFYRESNPGSSTTWRCLYTNIAGLDVFDILIGGLFSDALCFSMEVLTAYFRRSTEIFLWTFRKP